MAQPNPEFGRLPLDKTILAANGSLTYPDIVASLNWDEFEGLRLYEEAQLQVSAWEFGGLLPTNGHTNGHIDLKSTRQRFVSRPGGDGSLTKLPHKHTSPEEDALNERRLERSHSTPVQRLPSATLADFVDPAEYYWYDVLVEDVIRGKYGR